MTNWYIDIKPDLNIGLDEERINYYYPFIRAQIDAVLKEIIPMIGDSITVYFEDKENKFDSIRVVIKERNFIEGQVGFLLQVTES